MTNSENQIVDYYQRRAAEYDRIYSKPEQQRDFSRLRRWLADNVAGRTFDCGLAAFWCSHVPKSRLHGFLKSFSCRLNKDGALLLIDSKWVDEYRKPLSRTDEEGNTYQTRTLGGGSTYEIVKNFLSRHDIESALIGVSQKIEYLELDYLWAVKAVVHS